LSQSATRRLQIDYGLLTVMACLVFLGLLTLWSASQGAEGEMAGFAFKQMRWLLFGGLAIALCAVLDYRHLQTNAYVIYGVLLALLVAVDISGKASMGAQRWLSLGPLRLQPSEFMKIGIAIVIARFYAQEPSPPPYGWRMLVRPALLTAVPVALVVVQPDLGTALLVVGVACAVTLFQGVRWKVIATAVAAAAAGAPLAWTFLKDYQKQRILTFLDPEQDPTGAGYHIIQSKIAIGSGQVWGKGYLKGTQSHLRFLPERHTDFIFSVFAEEWGFAGSILVLVLFLFFILWGLDIAAKARDSFGRLLALGLTSILFIHAVVNLGMVMGLLPVVGVPLPLFSYGGSSVLTTCIIVGFLLSIRLRRFTS
jgi:rod shape determining protein RodA